MRFAPYLFISLIELTAPGGDPVYMVPSSVLDFSPCKPETMPPCRMGAKTEIRLMAGSRFVRESPQEVARRIRDAQ